MLTPYEIEQAIEDERERQNALVDELKLAVINLAESETQYKVAAARSRMRTRHNALERQERKMPSETAIEDIAVDETADELHAFLLAKNNVVHLREALATAKNNVEGLRTLAANNRLV